MELRAHDNTHMKITLWEDEPTTKTIMTKDKVNEEIIITNVDTKTFSSTPESSIEVYIYNTSISSCIPVRISIGIHWIQPRSASAAAVQISCPSDSGQSFIRIRTKFFAGLCS